MTLVTGDDGQQYSFDLKSLRNILDSERDSTGILPELNDIVAQYAVSILGVPLTTSPPVPCMPGFVCVCDSLRASIVYGLVCFHA